MSKNHITQVNVDLMSGKFKCSLKFNPNLNIISGTNGVGKTQLLSFIQKSRNDVNKVIFHGNNQHLKNIAAFSPKRNAQKVLMDQAQKALRADPEAHSNLLKQILNTQLQDTNIQTIKSVSEYVVMATENLVETQGHTKDSAAAQISKELTAYIQRLFPHSLSVAWDVANRSYSLVILKGNTPVQPSQLSSGENALISMILAFYYARENVQLFLVDEPEIHLNWELEEKLFNFLDWFSSEYQKQFVVVTHSRACFLPAFVDKTQFLSWEQGMVNVSAKPSEKIKNAIAGDIVKIVSGITAEDVLIYVEDSSQEYLVNKIVSHTGKSVETTVLNGRAEVLKICKAMKELNVENVVFLIDNDNQPVKDPALYRNLIRLEKYCVENYFLEASILEKIDKRPNKQKNIEQCIRESISQVNKQNFAILKTIVSSNIPLSSEILDRADGSQILPNLARILNIKDAKTLMDDYVNCLESENRLSVYFSELAVLF
jgi:ABC-type lipoprotein export system ATPase subunit